MTNSNNDTKILKTYPEYIMTKLREREELEPNDTSKDEFIMSMCPKCAFTNYLNWIGIIGYSSTILNLVEDIFDTKISGKDEC